jgi:hypothetical protein
MQLLPPSIEFRADAMKHVSLDTQDEAVKRFVMSLAINAEGSLLKLQGRVVAQILPAPIDRNGASSHEEWTDAKNARRCALVDKKIDGNLSAVEAFELTDLQQQMLRYRDRVAPLPLDYARQLHQELLNQSRVDQSKDGA